MRLTLTGKFVVLLLIAGLGFGAWRLIGAGGKLGALIPEKKGTGSVEVKRIDLPESGSDSGTVSPVKYTAPSATPGCGDKPEVRMLVWAWNAQMGAMLATGGPQATSG